MLNNKSILITGGTGSLGKALTRRITESFKPQKLIIYSRDELKQFEMAQHYPEEKFPYMRFLLGDVRDGTRMERAFHGVDYVIHAAALKQVPAAEYNPFECVKTNIYGAENIVNVAIACKVKKVVALSTDKACSPINLYGATKLVSDKIFTAGNNMSGDSGTRFSVVRYGNVVGSRGSVVPFFKKLLDDGANSLPITDRKMTRFWITIEQAVDLVLSSFGWMTGGEIFVPKIPSMKVVELAKVMAPEVDTHVVGIRPGEKLHEEMISVNDSRMTYEFDDRYVIEPSFRFWDGNGCNSAAKGGKNVGQDFSYSSSNNKQWIDAGDMKALLSQLNYG